MSSDDLTAVPTGDLERLRESVRRASALSLACFALLIVLAVTLARKRLITWPDIVGTVRGYG